MSLRPSTNGFVRIISANTQPTPHISTDGPYRRSPSNNSGGRYQRVSTQLVYSRRGLSVGWLLRGGAASYVLARPKSAIFILPWLLSRRFAAFFSRCNIFIYLSTSTS